MFTFSLLDPLLKQSDASRFWVISSMVGGVLFWFIGNILDARFGIDPGRKGLAEQDDEIE